MFRYIIFIFIAAISCKSKAIPDKFFGVWCRQERSKGICVDVSMREDHCVITQFYPDGSGPNTPNRLIYDTGKDILESPGTPSLTVQIETYTEGDALTVSYNSRVEQYVRDSVAKGRWKKY